MRFLSILITYLISVLFSAINITASNNSAYDGHDNVLDQFKSLTTEQKSMAILLEENPQWLQYLQSIPPICVALANLLVVSTRDNVFIPFPKTAESNGNTSKTFKMAVSSLIQNTWKVFERVHKNSGLIYEKMIQIAKRLNELSGFIRRKDKERKAAAAIAVTLLDEIASASSVSVGLCNDSQSAFQTLFKNMIDLLQQMRQLRAISDVDIKRAQSELKGYEIGLQGRLELTKFLKEEQDTAHSEIEESRQTFEKRLNDSYLPFELVAEAFMHAYRFVNNLLQGRVEVGHKQSGQSDTMDSDDAFFNASTLGIYAKKGYIRSILLSMQNVKNELERIRTSIGECIKRNQSQCTMSVLNIEVTIDTERDTLPTDNITSPFVVECLQKATDILEQAKRLAERMRPLEPTEISLGATNDTLETIFASISKTVQNVDDFVQTLIREPLGNENDQPNAQVTLSESRRGLARQALKDLIRKHKIHFEIFKQRMLALEQLETITGIIDRMNHRTVNVLVSINQAVALLEDMKSPWLTISTFFSETHAKVSNKGWRIDIISDNMESITTNKSGIAPEGLQQRLERDIMHLHMQVFYIFTTLSIYTNVSGTILTDLVELPELPRLRDDILTEQIDHFQKNALKAKRLIEKVATSHERKFTYGVAQGIRLLTPPMPSF